MYISTHCTEPSFDQIKKLKLSNHGITYCEDLSFLQFVQRIELDNNQLSSIDFMRDNNDANYVNVSHNQISDLTPLKNMKLQVLNASHNQLESLSSECFKSSVNSLKALIVSNNQLSSLPDLKFVDLNTLVISHNEIKNIDVIAKCEQLKKISASNNQIRLLPEGIKRCVALEELRSVNDWCIDLATGVIDPARARAMLDAYHAERPFTHDEHSSWQPMLRAAALRFWLSRLYDFHQPREAEMLTPHDPTHFERILRERIATPAPELFHE